MPVLTGPLAKLVWGGNLTDKETWACSLHLAGGEGEFLDDGLLLDSYVLPLKDWFERSDSNINQIATLDFVKFNEVDKVTGRYSDAGASNTFFVVPPHEGNASTQPGPPQLTAAVTLQTDKVRGRASKGRFYPPIGVQLATTTIMGLDGLLTTAKALAMANSAQELLSEINAVSAVMNVCVWSQIGQEARAVETVSVGRAVDTQIRRRKGMVDSRVAATAAV